MYKLLHPQIEGKSNKEVMKGLGEPVIMNDPAEQS